MRDATAIANKVSNPLQVLSKSPFARELEARDTSHVTCDARPPTRHRAFLEDKHALASQVSVEETQLEQHVVADGLKGPSGGALPQSDEIVAPEDEYPPLARLRGNV